MLLALTHDDSVALRCSEVCKISMRSAQKLLDHVNFSPLHQAALEGGAKLDNRLGSPKVSQQRRVIYDGTKLFWRINETLELCIYEDAGANCVTISAFQQQSAEVVKPALPSLALARPHPNVVALLLPHSFS